MKKRTAPRTWPAAARCEAGEALAVDGVVLLEAAEVEPVAAELDGQAAGTVVLQHAPGLGGEHLGPVQVAGRGVREQLASGMLDQRK
jgi:hypothetical protein